MSKYKAVGFDYGGVIGGGGMIGRDFTDQVCKLLDITKEEYDKVYFSLNHLINLGEILSWREFWPIFLEKLGMPEKLDNLMVISDEAKGRMHKLDQNVIDLADDLRGRGYKVGLLSNNTAENGQIIRKMGLDKHFDVFHISAETKLMKPNPAAFVHFVEELGVLPEGLIFIDDAPKSLSTAKECGFTPILFDSYEQLKDELSKLGVL